MARRRQQAGGPQVLRAPPGTGPACEGRPRRAAGQGALPKPGGTRAERRRLGRPNAGRAGPLLRPGPSASRRPGTRGQRSPVGSR